MNCSIKYRNDSNTNNAICVQNENNDVNLFFHELSKKVAKYKFIFKFGL